MNIHSELLIQLLSKAIRGQSINANALKEDTDWFPIYKEAQEHQVHTLIFPLVENLPSNKQPEAKLMSIWKKDVLLEASAQLSHIHQIGLVLDKFHKSGIPVIVLKGLVLRDFYPFPELRTMDDADILVHKEDLAQSKKLLVSLGYKEKNPGVKHIEFRLENFPTIELHWVLTNQEGKENTLSFTSLAWKNAVKAEIANAPCFSLSRDDQILHLLLHSVSHMMTGGFGLRQLCDLVLAVDAGKELIDWNKLLRMAANYQIEKFAITLLSVCSKYFSLEIPGEHPFSPENSSSEETYIDLLLQDIVNAGVFGRRTGTRETSDRVSKYIDVNNPLRKFASIYNIILFLFPPAGKLSFRYRYSQKHFYLLPLAWIHRGFHNMKRLGSLRFTMNKDIEATSKERAKLLHWLQLR